MARVSRSFARAQQYGGGGGTYSQGGAAPTQVSPGTYSQGGYNQSVGGVNYSQPLGSGGSQPSYTAPQYYQPVYTTQGVFGGGETPLQNTSFGGGQGVGPRPPMINPLLAALMQQQSGGQGYQQ